MSLYGIKHKIEPNISFHWDDSILVDTEKKRSQALIEKNAGLIDNVQYFIETRDYSEEEAIEFVEKIEQRSPKEIVEKEDKEE